MKQLEPNILEDVHQSVLRFLEPLSLEETYKRIVEESVRLTQGNYGLLVFKGNGMFMKIYSSSPEGYEVQTEAREEVYQVFTTRKALITHTGLPKEGIESIIYIPLAYKKKSIGVLIVNSKRNRRFKQKDLEMLQLFGSMASLAMRKTQLNQETKKALETRDLFISMASHELRTPITTIHGYAQLLQSRMKNEEGVVRNWVEELSKEVYRLTQLVKELLEIDRIKSGNLQYSYKEASISEIAERALNTVEFSYPHKKVLFENKLGSDDLVIGDFDKLLQAFSNVLENAAKYSAGNKDIKMTLSKKNNQFKITVKDHGIGIPLGEMSNLFTGYFQGKNHTREGLGLGLFLCKHIIQKHLGYINIKSKENRGTTVEIFLPKIQVRKSLVIDRLERSQAKISP